MTQTCWEWGKKEEPGITRTFKAHNDMHRLPTANGYRAYWSSKASSVQVLYSVQLLLVAINQNHNYQHWNLHSVITETFEMVHRVFISLGEKSLSSETVQKHSFKNIFLYFKEPFYTGKHHTITLILSNITIWIHYFFPDLFTHNLSSLLSKHTYNKVLFTSPEHDETLVVYLLPLALQKRTNSLFKMSAYQKVIKNLSIN